jgi:hypothetical protein
MRLHWTKIIEDPLSKVLSQWCNGQHDLEIGPEEVVPAAMSEIYDAIVVVLQQPLLPDHFSVHLLA